MHLKIEKTHNFAVVIMAAGMGTRMKDASRAKVMFEILGKPMIHYVLDIAYALQSNRIIVIVGYQREIVSGYIRRSHPNAEIVVQAEQLGTGHAVMQTESALEGFQGNVLVLSGDVPLLTIASLKQLIEHHIRTEAIVTILTADFENATGYGRIVRNTDGSVKKIVEEKDATEDERLIKEINSGIYLFNKRVLFEGLKHIKPDNIQNEYYLTDVFEYFWNHHLRVSALKATSVDEIRGINTVKQLEEASNILANRSQIVQA
jgi:UDP-N-acetylglucosamine diphosphorylase/glucosamine-1-phosphate N-acetyltransferase